MSVRLSHSEIHRIRARLAQASSPAAAATGDEVALRSALARDACALSAHCADVERSREIFSSVIFDDGAWYYRCSEGGWGFDDGKGGNSASGAGLSRIDAARGARSFGPEREREYAPLDEATLAAIAARAKEFTETTTMSTRAALTQALVADLPGLLAHAAALDDDADVAQMIFFTDSDVGTVRRHKDTRAPAYGLDDHEILGTNLDFDEAVRRGLFMSRLPEGVTEFPEWFVQDRADAAERERLKDEAEAPARAEEDRRRVEEERAKAEAKRVADAEKQAEYQRLKVTMGRAVLGERMRTFDVRQTHRHAKVTLNHCGDSRGDECPRWRAEVGYDDGLEVKYGYAETPEGALRAAIEWVVDPRPDFGLDGLRQLDWGTVSAEIEAFGPMPTDEEVSDACSAHYERMRSLSAALSPDVTRILAEHGIDAKSVYAREDDAGRLTIVVNVDGSTPG